MRKILAVALMLVVLTGCATVPGPGLGQRLADRVAIVSDEYRAVRTCLMAAAAVEILTDLTQDSRGGNASLVLGSLAIFQKAVDAMRTADTMWIESDMADVSLLFTRALKNAGKSRLVSILAGGPTVSNFLGVVRRTIIVDVKGDAVLDDVNTMLTALGGGTLDESAVWDACERRMTKNRKTLFSLTGV